jgi:uncharacterized membrane protein
MSEWMMRKNCSLTPAQTVHAYLGACVLVLSIGIAFTATGQWVVLVFSTAELLALGVMVLAYCRHARDFERISVDHGVLHIEVRSGSATWERDLMASVVRFEPHVPCKPVVICYGNERIMLGRHLPWPARHAFFAQLRQSCGGGAVSIEAVDHVAFAHE